MKDISAFVCAGVMISAAVMIALGNETIGTSLVLTACAVWLFMAHIFGDDA